MPVWTAALKVIALATGIPVTVFDGETLSDGQESQAVAIPPSKYPRNLTWRLGFASAPSSVSYQLQVAMNNVDAEYVAAGTAITSNDGGKVTITDVVARFARIVATDADTKAVTAEIMVH